MSIFFFNHVLIMYTVSSIIFAYSANPKENAFVKSAPTSSAPYLFIPPFSFSTATSPITPTPFFSPLRAIADTLRVPWPNRFRSFSSSVAASLQLSQWSTTTPLSSSFLVVLLFFLLRFFLLLSLFSSFLYGNSRPGGGLSGLLGGLMLTARASSALAPGVLRIYKRRKELVRGLMGAVLGCVYV